MVGLGLNSQGPLHLVLNTLLIPSLSLIAFNGRVSGPFHAWAGEPKRQSGGSWSGASALEIPLINCEKKNSLSVGWFGVGVDCLSILRRTFCPSPRSPIGMSRTMNGQERRRVEKVVEEQEVQILKIENEKEMESVGSTVLVMKNKYFALNAKAHSN